MKKITFTACLVFAFLSGCAGSPGPGAQEGVVPPKIVLKDNAKTWNNAGNFGPVPAALAAKGASTCATLNTQSAKYMATGYHSKALDMDGKPFPGGGYYCVRQ